jgi:hypothetical protein
VSSPAADDRVAVERGRAGPALWRPEDDDRPPGLDDRLGALVPGRPLDRPDLAHRPAHAGCHVDVDGVLELLERGVLWQAKAVLDDPDLVAVARVEAGNLKVVHRARDRPLYGSVDEAISDQR